LNTAKILAYVTLLTLPAMGSSVVAHLVVPTFEVGSTSNGWMTTTTQVDETYNLTITSTDVVGGSGYLVFTSTLQIPMASGGVQPNEDLDGYATLIVGNNQPVTTSYGNPVVNCSAYGDKCSIPFTFGQEFSVRVQASAIAQYIYRGVAPQQIHSSTTSINITPTVWG
jgi:hypothetical protein